MPFVHLFWVLNTTYLMPFLRLFWVLSIMYLMPEDGQYDRNVYHVLTVLIKLVVVDGLGLSNFNYVKLTIFRLYILLLNKCTCSIYSGIRIKFNTVFIYFLYSSRYIATCVSVLHKFVRYGF
jgi:hypothetical protein